LDELGQALAILLASAFALAAAAKLRDRAATGESFRGLRLPVAAALVWLVPVFEMALSVGLIVAPRAAAWMALLLIAAFTIVVVRAVAGGVQVPCACFGALSDTRPVSAREVVRNAMLAAGAVVATGAPPGDALWPTPAGAALAAGLWLLGGVVLRLWPDRLHSGP
jgi:hypothetical protein